jgi:hypothetical protein
MTFDELMRQPVYGFSQEVKERVLLDHLNELTARHRERCMPYKRLLTYLRLSEKPATRYCEVPYVPVGLFKSHELLSVPREDVQMVMTSSGTTGQQVSRIYLDRETARRQTIALSRIMQYVLGPQRLPMLIIDSRAILANRQSLSARGVGVLGMMNFGRNHTFALPEETSLLLDQAKRFLAEHGSRPFLVFGFTFMVWQYFSEHIRGTGLDFSNGILIHSGGWKKLQEQSISNTQYKAVLKDICGLEHVHNFYGMVEQVGGVFLEGEDGYFYPPAFSDVIIRDPETWDEVPLGTEGIIQLVSALPYSYPGHSLLTEDLGVIRSISDTAAGRMGKAFEVLGRLPRAELRGCSDTHAYGDAA